MATDASCGGNDQCCVRPQLISSRQIVPSVHDGGHLFTLRIDFNGGFLKSLCSL